LSDTFILIYWRQLKKIGSKIGKREVASLFTSIQESPNLKIHDNQRNENMNDEICNLRENKTHIINHELFEYYKVSGHTCWDLFALKKK
jgi:hypothetical protein